MHPLIWSVLLLLLSVGFVLLEMLVPSWGVLSFLSFTSAVAAVIVAFISGGPVVGTVVLCAVVVVLPAVIALAIRWWPHTPIGRRIINLPPASEDDVLPNDEATLGLRKLVGKRGKAETVMLPAGTICVEGRTLDAVSEGMPIESGQDVVVSLVEGNRIIVRPLLPSEGAEDGNILSQPLDLLGLDELDGPLT